MALARAGEIAAALLIVLLAGFLLSRRLNGALVQPLPGALLLATGLAWAGLVLATLPLTGRKPALANFPSPRRAEQISSAALRTVLTLTSICALAALSFRGSSGLILLIVWGMALGLEYIRWRPLLRTLELPAIELRRRTRMPRLAEPSADIEETEQEEELSATDVTQQMLRRQTATGERVEGTFRVAFLAGERSRAAHIAFCPPLEGELVCSAEAAEGPSAAVRVTQLLAWSARFEVKLDRGADFGDSVAVEFVAEGNQPSPEGRPS